MPHLSPDAQAFDQRKQERLLKPELFDQLKSILPLSDHVIWGHGTLADISARAILEEGISGNQNYDLYQMATPLSSSEKSADENIHYIIEQSQNWPHRKARYVVLLAVPHGVKPNNAVERTEDETRGPRATVPRRFIIGYIDSETNTFIRSRFFTPNAAPTPGLYQSFQGKPLPQQRREPLPTQPSEVISLLPAADGDDIW